MSVGRCWIISASLLYRVGIILNFKHARLEWERLVLTNDAKIDRDKGELIL